MCQSNRSNGIPSYQEKEATTSLNKKRSYQIFTLNVTSASSQDGLTGNGFILLPETTKKKKKHNKTVSDNSFQDSEHLARKDNSDSWERENKADNPYGCLSLLPWREFPGCRKGKGKWRKPNSSTGFRDLKPVQLQLRRICTWCNLCSCSSGLLTLGATCAAAAQKDPRLVKCSVVAILKF